MNNQSRDQEQQFTPNLQTGSGLTRYRSAPSSYFASLLSDDNVLRTDDDDLDRMFNTRAVSPETRRIFSRFINGSDTIQEEPSQSQFNPQFVNSSSDNKGGGVVQQTQQGNDYSSPSQMTYHHHHQSHNSDAAPSSLNSNQNANMKIEGGNSGLVRYNSSPAGFFANMNMDSDFGAMRGIGNFGGSNNSNNAEASSVSSTSRFKAAQRYFTSRPSSSTMMIDPIPEIETKGDLGIKYENSWDDSEFLPDNFLRGMSDKNFSDANASNDHHQNHRLTHHLSLPKTSSELSAVENMFQDSVPCKIRAKRGCATHPRSIAERVRRTKISERMRKLQELVPNMDKQTSTSDMLDLAVEYIKDLQRQVEALTDIQAKCTCS